MKFSSYRFYLKSQPEGSGAISRGRCTLYRSAGIGISGEMRTPDSLKERVDMSEKCVQYRNLVERRGMWLLMLWISERTCTIAQRLITASSSAGKLRSDKVPSIFRT